MKYFHYSNHPNLHFYRAGLTLDPICAVCPSLCVLRRCFEKKTSKNITTTNQKKKEKVAFDDTVLPVHCSQWSASLAKSSPEKLQCKKQNKILFSTPPSNGLQKKRTPYQNEPATTAPQRIMIAFQGKEKEQNNYYISFLLYSKNIFKTPPPHPDFLGRPRPFLGVAMETVFR